MIAQVNHTPRVDPMLPAVMPLLGAAEAAAALGACLRLQREGTTVEAELSASLNAVLDALGVRDAVMALDAQEAAALLGLVEGFLAQAADSVATPGRSCWDHEDPRILNAQGNASARVAEVLQRSLVPSLGDDLTVRMESVDAAFLDVGTGIAALAVAICRVWPAVHVIGIDPWQPALALAREHVAAAGLQERIELRHTSAEELEDIEQFDLAWVPTFFIPNVALELTIARVHAALRPGGWATLGLYARPGNPLMDALADLRTVRQGGSLRQPQELATSLEHAGFSNVGIHSSGEWNLPIVFVAGQRSTTP